MIGVNPQKEEEETQDIHLPPQEEEVELTL